MAELVKMQARHPVRIHTHNRIIPLESLWNSIRDNIICKKGNSGIFKHHNRKSTVFQGFHSLEKAAMNLKYFQTLQEPV